MKPDIMFNILLAGFGFVLLYVAWGNAWGVLGLGDQCLPKNPEGLHLDAAYQLVYEHDVCTAYVYEYGRPVFIGLSVLGLGGLIGGLHRIRQQVESTPSA